MCPSFATLHNNSFAFYRVNAFRLCVGYFHITSENTEGPSREDVDVQTINNREMSPGCATQWKGD